MAGVDLDRLRREADDRLSAGERATLVPCYRRLVEATGAGADVELLRSLGICLEASGEREEAVEFYRKVIAKAPHDTIALRRLAQWEAARGWAAAPLGVVPPRPVRQRLLPSHEDAKQQFLRVFPQAFRDPQYLERERGYKWAAHERFKARLPKQEYEGLLRTGDFEEICGRLRSVYGGLNLLSIFENAALRDAMKIDSGATVLATAVFDMSYGESDGGQAFDSLVTGLHRLNARRTSPAKWPIVTIFPFLADPGRHIFVKPAVTKRAASRFRFELGYRPDPSSATYGRVQEFATRLLEELRPLGARDNIDVQSFVWVTNSEGYSDFSSDGDER